MFTDESGTHNALTYYVLCMDGSLYSFYLWADYDAAAQNGLAYSLRFVRKGDIGLKFSDPTSLSMTLIRNGLVIADSTTASLYWVELDETLSSGKIANLPGVTAISGLYDPAETNASAINQNVAVPTSGTLLSETLKAEPLYEMKSTVAHENGCLCIIQMRVRDFILNIHLLQRVHFVDLYAHSHRTNLLIITNNNQLFAHV